MIVKKAFVALVYRGFCPISFSRPSACIRTLMRSSGRAHVCPEMPVMSDTLRRLKKSRSSFFTPGYIRFFSGL